MILLIIAPFDIVTKHLLQILIQEPFTRAGDFRFGSLKVSGTLLQVLGLATQVTVYLF